MSNALVAIGAATALSRHPNAPHPIGLLRPPGHCQATAPLRFRVQKWVIKRHGGRLIGMAEVP